MTKIKSDFHIHTSADREDPIEHSSKELIDHAVAKGFKAIAITNHNTFTYSLDLENYAKDRGVVLIPGIEKTIEGKHVLILNAFPAIERISSFTELRAAKEDGVFIIAPHPFHGTPCCLGPKLHQHLELFDALEFSYFYCDWLNPNLKMLSLAEESNLPVVGNSDCHLLKYFAACHSILQVEEISVEGVFSAIRSQNIKVVSKPQTFSNLVKIFIEMKATQFKLGWQAKRQSPVFIPGSHPEELNI